MVTELKNVMKLEKMLHECSLDMENHRIWTVIKRTVDGKITEMRATNYRIRILTDIYEKILRGNFIVKVFDDSDDTFNFKVSNIEGRFGDYDNFKIIGRLDEIKFTFKDVCYHYKKEEKTTF